MRTITLPLELITPGLCGGAEPDKKAEIRVPTIRGQLRWWFRVLGGFKVDRELRTQEQSLFGGVHDEAVASQLRLSVANAPVSQDVRLASAPRENPDVAHLRAPMGSPRGYLLFPFRKKERGVFAETHLPRFDLRVQWLGDAKAWPDILALLRVLAELGSLGSRSRRAMGALSLQRDIPSLPALGDALQRFKDHDRLQVIDLGGRSSDDAIDALGNWLKSWRAHGRTNQNESEMRMPGFKLARDDHDTGASLLQPQHHIQPTFRPALGMPIIQFFSSTKQQVDWNISFNPDAARKSPTYKGEGRFASPVLLRPRRIRDANGRDTWQALVLFADARVWPDNKQVHLSSPRHRDVTAPVSRALYDEMKRARPASGLFPQPAARPAADALPR